jgi:hypothetical protein
MSWFKRTDDPTVKDDYLQTTDTVSRPMALVFTVLIVLVMAAVVFSLFWGGRWLFQHLDGSDQVKVQVVTNPITVTTPTAASVTANGSATSGSSSSGSANSGGSSTVAGSNNQTQSANTNGQATQQAISATAIPATGPTETLTIFLTVVLLATIGHSIWQRQRNS